MELANGRYHIKKKLSESKVAIVSLAYDTQAQREVVLKEFLHPGADAAFDSYFSETMAKMVALQHEALAPVYDYGELNGHRYITMPYYAGGSLASRLLSGPLPLAQITPILERMCRALHAAHEQGLVHHHLTPENILFDEQGNAYLSDFGVVCIGEEGQMATFVTDPYYTSPEQSEGRLADAQTNVYQVGLLLFQMLTGRVPFEAPTASAILRLHRYALIPLARRFNPALPLEVQGILKQALAKTKDERFKTPIDLLRAWWLLDNLSTASMVTSVVPWRRPNVQTGKRRSPWLGWLLGGIGLVVVLAAVGAIFWAGGRADATAGSATSTATQVVELLPVATETATLLPTLTPTAVVEPTATATHAPTATATPSQTPRLTAMPSATATPSATHTPTPTATSTLTPTSLPTWQTIRLGGQPAGTVQNPITFTWSGVSNVDYRVVLNHAEQNFAHTSAWLPGFSWTFSIPAQEFGGWSWYVEDRRGARSDEGFFWFNQFPGSGGGNTGGGATAVPTDPPPPP